MGDYYNIIHTAEEEAEKRGLEKGIAQGKAEGREEGRTEGITEGEQNKAREIAMRLIADGMSVEQIVQYTGLDRETVEQL